ncbi:MAG TPA: hypothetical protein VHM65_09245 [Candidatus Lustribacter sp.]|nr:hypothetical protein [Candidatus Lustribacter sp.]
MSRVENAVARPVRGDVAAWVAGVAGPIGELADDFGEHIEVTEGPAGLYQDLMTVAPRLSGTINRLIEEHQTFHGLFATIASLEASAAKDPEHVDELRETVIRLLALLTRHRARGSELVWEAYTFDVGGEM